MKRERNSQDEEIRKLERAVAQGDAGARRKLTNLAPEITSRADVLGGKPVIAGTRIPASLVVGKVAGGMTLHEVAESYGITDEQVSAALNYAALILEKSDPESAAPQSRATTRGRRSRRRSRFWVSRRDRSPR